MSEGGYVCVIASARHLLINLNGLKPRFLPSNECIPRLVGEYLQSYFLCPMNEFVGMLNFLM
jgi:hypothetical protein